MLYPEIEPYQIGHLQVSTIHQIYFEESGNPKGQPILFLHGGPGSGTDSNHRRYFDLSHYRIILFDQRGCGKSTPHACIEENTTFDLVDDIEKLRQHLKIDSWIIFGGSWGSLLGLTYAILHPKKTSALILRGIFLCTDDDLNWFFYDGAPKVFPEFYAKLIEVVPQKESILACYQKLLNHPDESICLDAATRWNGYEGRALKMQYDEEFFKRIYDPKISLPIARIECHYFINEGFFKQKDWLLSRLHTLNSIPMKIIHGRYDMVCPIQNAFILKNACPNAELFIVEDAGHASSEPGILKALIESTNSFMNLKK
jgi:proline iminopeptidase